MVIVGRCCINGFSPTALVVSIETALEDHGIGEVVFREGGTLAAECGFSSTATTIVMVIFESVNVERNIHAQWDEGR